ncbi:hypothetical protein ABTN20_19535, partial [Acinetobacter baumannii]
VQIIAQARVPTEKSSPKTGMMVAMAAVATLLLGLAIVIVQALFTGARGAALPSAAPASPPAPRKRAAPAAAQLAANRSAAPSVPSVAKLARLLV